MELVDGSRFARHADAYDGCRVLVTGGAGAIGSNLTRALLEIGATVTVVDDLRAGHRWLLPEHRALRFIEGDVLDDRILRSVVGRGTTVVFHLAAFFANQNSADFPEDDLEVNGTGTLRLLEYCRLGAVARFVFASSSSIYGDQPTLPVTENQASTELSTPYQITKLLGEMYCSYYARYCGLSTVSLRFFNSFGPGEVPGRYRNVVPNFFYRAMSGLPLE
ncbi:MAG: NAD-dependent epimerase/dehydratase family protein, partial [Pirellulales bacterium]|nr:NAD-dependent epimerase/dehydratase family protein [Pirellulales bacterium]